MRAGPGRSSAVVVARLQRRRTRPMNLALLRFYLPRRPMVFTAVIAVAAGLLVSSEGAMDWDQYIPMGALPGWGKPYFHPYALSTGMVIATLLLALWFARGLTSVFDGRANRWTLSEFEAALPVS